MNDVEKYISYISSQRRYSARTREIYSSILDRFCTFSPDAITPASIRNYQIYLLDTEGLSPRTVNLHLSVISSYCKYLIHQGIMNSNPVSLVVRPRQSRRLPAFFNSAAMSAYMSEDNALDRRDFELELGTQAERKDTYWLCLRRIIVCTLFCTGMRRAELISLRQGDFDRSRGVMHVRGKGDKMREIPLLPELIEEISLYLQSVRRLVNAERAAVSDPLFVTWSNSRLYPVLVDRAVKEELGHSGKDFAGRKSPHVLRHSFATGLMEEGADLNSIKEVLGHANLAATQVYTHSSIKALKNIYEQAHPRAANKGGKHGD
ncbi:MAG: tyrosine-type recombinase/integrase [Bacteroidales bacterium]|nr:tyrosine-type recombinase/integrase [Candidatus Hennigimonas equi]